MKPVVCAQLRAAAARLLLLSFLASGAAQGATPVEDRTTGNPAGGVSISTPQPVLPDELTGPAEATVRSEPYRGARSVPAAPAPGSTSSELALRGGQNTQLFYEIQQLQSEVLQLRGLLEDQAFEIQRLRELQRSQYLDIDRRLTEGTGGVAGQEASGLAGATGSGATPPSRADNALSSTTPQPIVGNEPARPAGSGSIVVQTGGSATPAQAAGGNQQGSQPVAASVPVSSDSASPEPERAPTEQEAYTRAFELMKDQQFEQSIAAYQGVVDTFPDGKYAPESRYWLGELYLMSDRLEDARGAFNQVVDRFPAHQKVPLSLYKLGVVNHRLGVTPRALEYLNDVVVRYPDTPAAGLARTYAAELR